MSSDEFPDKPSQWLMVLPVGLMFATLVPIRFLVERLNVVLGIPPGSAMSPANAAIWTVMMIVIVVANFAAGLAVGCLANALICRYLLGWPSEKIRAALVKSLAPGMLASVPSPDKPSVWFEILPNVFGFASLGPWIYFVFPLLDVPQSGKPPQSIGANIEAVIMIFVGFPVFLAAGAIVGCLANVLICRYLLGWPSKKIRATFVKSLKYDIERSALTSNQPDSWADTPRSRITQAGTRALLNKINPPLIRWLGNDEKWRWLEGDEQSSGQ